MIDFYCERTGPALWAEPLNALTNMGYLAAAWAVARSAWPSPRTASRLLAILLAAIGGGSALFHTFATPWARLLDELPILLFQLAYLWLYTRWIMGVARVPTAGILAALLIAVLAGRGVPDVLNGSLRYGPALLVAIILGTYHYATQRFARLTLPAAALAFVTAILFRTMDQAVCAAMPTGTHFLWHILTAAALYLFARGLLLNVPERAGGV